MSQPIDHEPLLPKISLRWLIGLVTVCAVAMGVVQQAITTGQMWAVLTTVVIASLVLPLMMNAGTFSLASLFSMIGSAAVGAEQPARVYSPTTEMPTVQRMPVDQAPSGSSTGAISEAGPAEDSHGNDTLSPDNALPGDGGHQ